MVRFDMPEPYCTLEQVHFLVLSYVSSVSFLCPKRQCGPLSTLGMLLKHGTPAHHLTLAQGIHEFGSQKILMFHFKIYLSSSSCSSLKRGSP